MNDEILIRLADRQDADILTEFNILMARETEGKTLAPEVVGSGVKHLLQNHRNGFYVVAEKQDDVVGSLMVTSEWSDWRDGIFWWFQSVYVRRQCRRQGVFRKLYEFVKSRADKEPDVCGLRLYVEQNNITAQKTYSAIGMEETHYKIFEEIVTFQ